MNEHLDLLFGQCRIERQYPDCGKSAIPIPNAVETEIRRLDSPEWRPWFRFPEQASRVLLQNSHSLIEKRIIFKWKFTVKRFQMDFVTVHELPGSIEEYIAVRIPVGRAQRSARYAADIAAEKQHIEPVVVTERPERGVPRGVVLNIPGRTRLVVGIGKDKQLSGGTDRRYFLARLGMNRERNPGNNQRVPAVIPVDAVGDKRSVIRSGCSRGTSQDGKHFSAVGPSDKSASSTPCLKYGTINFLVPINVPFASENTSPNRFPCGK